MATPKTLPEIAALLDTEGANVEFECLRMFLSYMIEKESQDAVKVANVNRRIDGLAVPTAIK